MNTTVPQIKIDPRGKGFNNYEDYLLQKHQRELLRFLNQKDIIGSRQTKVFKIYKRHVKRENIISLYTHPMIEFLFHLLDGTLDKLITNTSCTNLPVNQ